MSLESTLATVVTRGVVAGFGVARGLVLAGVVVAVAANACARWVLVPVMEAAGDDAFGRYHGRSVALNGVTMVAVAVALVASHF